MTDYSVVELKGALTLETVAAWLGRALPAGDLVFDFSGVTRVDSSALALLLAWLRRSRARGRVVELRAPPESLLALARLYGVDALLPLAA
ncbi:MAG: STAS domain-containing protein [Betaproteobacteria bacterium]|nr:STAS domain-containing protein [Betaproteobacteria bacterium]